jgi:tagatose 6-phosphate kinase
MRIKDMILTVTLNAAIDKRYVVDNFKTGEVNRVKECTYVPGGKGLNVSKPASIYGAEVVATGFVGGHAGAYIEDALKPFGIKSAFYHVGAESRSCINIWDEINQVQTEFLEPGFTLTDEDFAGFEEKFRGLVKEAKVVAMSGSVPKGLDGTAYQRLVKIVKDAGIPVILDTSGRLLEMGIEAAPTMIKPNIDEIRMITGKHCDDIQDIINAAKEIHAKGVEIVAVSLGGDGSIVVGDEGIFRARVPKIDAVNTVGCGDSMIAGFALGLSKGLSLPETLKLASAISAAAAMREETGFFVIEDMEKLFPQIEITKL